MPRTSVKVTGQSEHIHEKQSKKRLTINASGQILYRKSASLSPVCGEGPGPCRFLQKIERPNEPVDSGLVSAPAAIDTSLWSSRQK
jgi:hypothetical protein